MLTRANDYGREELVRYLKLRLLIIFLALAACGNDNTGEKRTQVMNNSAMVSGPGEKTLAQKYNLNIRLPMPEDEFLQMLRRLKLHYEICGRRDTEVGLPPVRHQGHVDLSNAQTCYDIDGDRNSKGVAESWRAFSDQRHQIFYIETTYAYQGL